MHTYWLNDREFAAGKRKMLTIQCYSLKQYIILPGYPIIYDLLHALKTIYGLVLEPSNAMKMIASCGENRNKGLAHMNAYKMWQIILLFSILPILFHILTWEEHNFQISQ